MIDQEDKHSALRDLVGLYRRDGEWSGEPAFRLSTRLSIWLVYDEQRKRWAVQSSGERSSSRSFVWIELARGCSPLLSAGWKNESGRVELLRCRAVDDQAELKVWEAAALVLYRKVGGAGIDHTAIDGRNDLGRPPELLGAYERCGVINGMPVPLSPLFVVLPTQHTLSNPAFQAVALL